MIKKTIRVIVLIAVLLTLFPLTCAAEDNVSEKLRDYAGLDGLEENLPSELKDSGELNELDASDGNLFSVIGSKLSDMLFSAFSGSLGFFAGLISLIIVSAVMSALGDNLSSGGVKSAFTYISVLALCLFSYNCVSELYNLTADYLRQVNVYVAAVMPSLELLNTAVGGSASALIQSSGVTAAIGVLETLTASVIAPVIRFSFAFILAGTVSDIDLSGFARGIRRAVTVGISFVMSLLSAVLCFQSGFASAADNVAFRSVRFAASSFIPVIGSMVGDAMGTILSSVRFLKSAAGMFCIAAVLFLLAVPILRLVAVKIMFSLAGFACTALGLERQAGIMKEIKETLNVLLVLSIASGIFFILALTVFMRTNLTV